MTNCIYKYLVSKSIGTHWSHTGWHIFYVSEPVRWMSPSQL